MTKSTNTAMAPTSPSPVDWTGTRTRRVEYKPEATIFAQSDPAASVMYADQGAVHLSVLSHAGQEAVVAALDVAHSFGRPGRAIPVDQAGTGASTPAHKFMVVSSTRPQAFRYTKSCVR